ncbi:hypothetical protein AAFF_G00025060 [Aldrovandia affinis]|uniref:Uncharacterized protein n=1 Tax=Aldrovandia affinis TaxID=143900 RepID=A0AAD7T686_9TELE|nr:hypothetical protein AAFF_G00025060 [Aldrovandia affinis]
MSRVCTSQLGCLSSAPLLLLNELWDTSELSRGERRVDQGEIAAGDNSAAREKTGVMDDPCDLEADGTA